MVNTTRKNVFRMSKLQEIKKEKTIKSTTTASTTKLLVTTTIITVFSISLVLFAGPAVFSTVYAEPTDTINASKIVNASMHKVWGLVSDVNKNPDFWPISIVKDINKTSNAIERQVTVPAPPFMDNKAHQVITIIPEQFKVIENQTKGAVTGVKIISLSKDGNPNKTVINVVWNLDLSRIPGIGQGFAKQGISNSVDEALTKIANASTKL